MAIVYQKALKVRNGSLSGQEGFYDALGEEACLAAGGDWNGSSCDLSVERPRAEKYNKLAKAFNDRLINGLGDPTWRLFFYAHSMTKGMIRPDESGLVTEAAMHQSVHSDSITKHDNHEDIWWKIYSHIELSTWKSRGQFKNFSQFVWPTGAEGAVGGANLTNHFVSYIYGTAGRAGKNGGVRTNFHGMKNMPPEWFRLGMVPISLFPSTSGWDNHGSDYPLWYYDEAVNYNNSKSARTGRGFGSRHLPITLTEKWVLAKLQRGGAAMVSIDGSPARKLRAEAPAYFAPRILYKWNINWRSPFGKYAPSYAPSANIIAYCAWEDKRFPPRPIYEYKFRPINPETHSNLSFVSSCKWQPGTVTAVRRKYDYYEIEFVGGFHFSIVDFGNDAIGIGSPVKGPLKLPYRHYLEGPYEGGGKMGKREAHYDQLDQVQNYFNSGFRKTPDMAKKDKLMEIEAGEGTSNTNVYNNAAEATFDLPSYNFEFEKFFTKQYALAPAYAGEMQISTKDGVIPPVVPRYPRLIVRGTGTIDSDLATKNQKKVFWFHEKTDNGYGEYENVGSYRFKPVNGFCVAGYFIWGTGIEMREISVLGGSNQLLGHSLTFNINRYDLFESSDDGETVVTVSTKALDGTGQCRDSSNARVNDGNGDTLPKETCLNVNGRSWVQEGVFQKMLYFDAGEEVTNKRIELEHATTQLSGPTSKLTNVSFVDSSHKKKTGGEDNEYSTSRSEIVMELAHILDYKPDLPDSLALLRIASTGKGSKKEIVENTEDVFFGPLDGHLGSPTLRLPSTKERAIGLDTRGKDMDYVADKGKDSDSTLRSKLSEPFDIWQEYNEYGYIPNIMGALELPDKMAQGFNKASDFTLANLTANALGGGDPFSNKSTPINFNPVYDAGRELIHDNLRMAPRSSLVDYRVEENCPYCSNEYYTTETSCIAAGYDWGAGEKKDNNGDSFNFNYTRDKSVLTFERFANGFSDAGNPKMGGLNKETTDTIVYNPMAVKPRNTEG